MSVSIPSVTPPGGLPSTQGLNFKKPQMPDFSGMLGSLTGMTAKMTTMKGKMTAMQGMVMAVPKPMGVPFNISTNFSDMIKSFTNFTDSINGIKSMITGFQNEWKIDNPITAGSDILEGGAKDTGQFGTVSGQNSGFSAGGGFSMPGQSGKLI